MATVYVVLKAEQIDLEPDEVWTAWKVIEETLQATNAEQACRRAAERMGEDLDESVELRAVPARNWKSGRNTFAAKTERKLIRS